MRETWAVEPERPLQRSRTGKPLGRRERGTVITTAHNSHELIQSRQRLTHGPVRDRSTYRSTSPPSPIGSASSAG
jgi:hypothetical protein